MKTYPRPLDVVADGDEAAHTRFTWRMDRVTYPDLPQLEKTAPRGARGFCVEDEIWFDPYPLSDHVRWWDTVISDEYDREWLSTEPNHIIYFKVPDGGDVLVPNPKTSVNADGEAVLRFAHLLEELAVPPEAAIYWAVTDRSAARDTAAAYYDLLETR